MALPAMPSKVFAARFTSPMAKPSNTITRCIAGVGPMHRIIAQPASLTRSGRGGAQFNADQFLPVVNVGAAIRERRMAPKQIATARVLAGLRQVGLADLLETFRRQPAEDQFSLVIPHKHAVLLLHKKDRRKGPRFACHRIALPKAISSFRVEAPQFAIAAQPVD